MKNEADSDMSHTMTVIKTSIFPAGRHEVFQKLQKLSTLQKIALPYATFTPVDGQVDTTWKPGSISSYKFRLFGIIPFGTHAIHVIRFDEEAGIYTHEKNEHVPIWNHEIILRELTEYTCEYTDKVEIGAGWKTVFVFLWACCFYSHRQRKWVRLLKKSARGNGK